MVKRTAVFMMVAVVLCSCTMWNKTASGWAGATGGENIERLFWDDVRNNDFRSVELHLSSTVVVTGPSGTMDRSAFLQKLHSYQGTVFSLSECSSKLNGEDLMITCILQRDGDSGGRFNTLSVWQQYKKGWLMVAHSETPVSQ